MNFREAQEGELPLNRRRRTSAKPNSRKFAVTKSRPSRRGSALRCSPAALSPPETSKIDTPVTAKSGKQARVRTSELPEDFSLIGGPRRPGSSRVKLWLREHNTSQNALPLLRRFWFVWTGAITKTAQLPSPRVPHAQTLIPPLPLRRAVGRAGNVLVPRVPASLPVCPRDSRFQARC